jgi:hypothetical protein
LLKLSKKSLAKKLRPQGWGGRDNLKKNYFKTGSPWSCLYVEGKKSERA